MLRMRSGRSVHAAAVLILVSISSAVWAAPRAYVGGSAGGGAVSVVDLNTNMIQSTIYFPIASGVRGQDLDSGNNRLFVADPDSIDVIDLTTNSIIDSYPGSGEEFKSVRLNPAGNRLYVPAKFGPFGQVSVFNASTGAALTPINTGGEPVEMVFHPNGSTAYVINIGTSSLQVIDLASNAVTTNVALGELPAAIAINPSGSNLVVSFNAASQIRLYDTQTLNQIGATPINQAGDIIFNADGSQMYILSADFFVGLHDIRLIRLNSTLNLTGNTSLGIVNMLPSAAASVALGRSETRAYVTDPQRNKLFIVDTAAFSLLGDLDISGAPGPIVVTPDLPQLVATPPSGSTLNFPNFAVGGAPSSVQIQFQNPASAPGDLSCQPLSNSRFSLASNPLVVPAGGSAHLQIQFSSVTTGSFSTTLSCLDGSGQSFSYTLEAVALGELIITPVAGSTINLGEVLVGGPPAHAEIDLRNESELPISANCTATGDPQFTFAPSMFSVPGFGNMRLRLQFESAVAGSFNSNLQCALGSGAPIAFTLTGKAFAPLTASPASGSAVTLPTTSQNAPPAGATIVFHNANALAATVSCAVSPTSAFDLSQPSLLIPANDSAGLNVELGTATQGSFVESLRCTGPGSQPLVFQLTGRVAQPIYAYLTDSVANVVRVLDTADGRIAAVIPVGTTPIAVAVDAQGARAYIANRGSDSVSVIDSTSLSVIATIPVQTRPVAIAVNDAGTRAYVANLQGASVSVIDTNSLSVIATVPGFFGPVAIEVNHAGTHVLVASQGPGSSAVHAIDTMSNAIVATSPSTPGTFRSIAVAPDDSRFVATMSPGDFLSVYGPNANLLVSTNTGPADGIAWLADGSSFLVASQEQNRVFFREGASTALQAQLTVNRANGVAIHPSGRRAYVGSDTAPYLSVIDPIARSLLPSPALNARIDSIGRFVNGPQLLISSAPATASTVRFPTVRPGTAAVTAVSFQNPDLDAASVQCSALTVPEFARPAEVLALPARGNTQALLNFSGGVAGSYTDTLICSGSGGETFQFNLIAEVLSPMTSTPGTASALVFSEHRVGAAPTTRQIDFFNGGPLNQQLDCSLPANSRFSLPAGPFPVPGNASHTLQLIFESATPGSFEDTLSCLGPAGQSWRFALQASARAPLTAALASGSTISWAPGFLGSTQAARTLEFGNPNPSAETISCTTPSADFSASPSPLNLPAVGNNTLNLTFLANQPGSYAATLNCVGSGGEQFSYSLSAVLYEAPIAYVSNLFGQSVSLIDTQTGNTVAELALGSAPKRIAVHPSGVRALVTMPNADTVAVIDAPGVLRATIAVGDQPDAVVITPDGRRALIGNIGDGTLSVIDMLSLQVSATIAVPNGVSSLVLTADGTTAYAGAPVAGSVTRIDLASLTVAGSFASCENGVDAAIDPGQNLLYLACAGNDSVGVYDLQTQTQVAMILIGPSLYRVIVHPSLPIAYALFVDGLNPGIRRIATQGFTAAATVGMGGAIQLGMRLHPDGERLLTSVYSGPQANRLSIRDAQTLAEIGSAATGNGPSDIALQSGPPSAALSATPDASSLIVLPTRVLGAAATMAFIDFQNLSSGSVSLQCEVQPGNAFSVLPAAMTIAAMQTETVAISYAATSAGTTGGTLSCTAANSQEFLFNLSGTTLADVLLRDGFE